MAEAVDIQNLVTALACRYITERKVHHRDIPDRPSIESERRQIFFAGAVGIPTFYVRADTGNRLLRKILAHVSNQRNSRRYKGYIRVKIADYKLALLHIIKTDGADLIDQLGLAPRMLSLHRRLTDESVSTYGKIIDAVQQEQPGKRSPRDVPADEFNLATERYYRNVLKQKHLGELLLFLSMTANGSTSWKIPTSDRLWQRYHRTSPVQNLFFDTGRQSSMKPPIRRLFFSCSAWSWLLSTMNVIATRIKSI